MSAPSPVPAVRYRGAVVPMPVFVSEETYNRVLADVQVHAPPAHQLRTCESSTFAHLTRCSDRVRCCVPDW